MVNKKIIRGPLLLYLLFLSPSVSRIPIIILYPNLFNPKLSISISVHANTKHRRIFLAPNLIKVSLFLFLCSIALFSCRCGFGFSSGLFWVSSLLQLKTKKKHFGSCWRTLLLLLFSISSSLK